MFLKRVTRNKHLNIEVLFQNIHDIFMFSENNFEIITQKGQKWFTSINFCPILNKFEFLLFVPASDHRLRPPHSCTCLKIILLQPLPIPLKVFSSNPVRFGTTSKTQAHLWRDSSPSSIVYSFDDDFLPFPIMP